MKNKIFVIIFILSAFIQCQTKYSEINEQIEKGNYSQAQSMIETKLIDRNISELEKYDLKFQVDLMERIRKDFRRTRDEVMDALKKYYPDLTADMMENWEKDNSLEMKIIDGEKRYFNNAVPNLFRINKEAKIVKEKIDGNKPDDLDVFLENYIPKIVETAIEKKDRYVLPVKMKIKYSLTVKPNSVPDGEIIRCWLPYPRESNPRQTDIQLVNVSTSEYVIADDNNLQRTIYLEGKSKKDQPTKFEIELIYTSKAEYINLFDGSKNITFNKNKGMIFRIYKGTISSHRVF